MTDFSVSHALGAGFRIIRRKPLAPLVWGLVYFAIAVLPLLLVMGMAAPALMEAMHSGLAGAEPKMDPSMMAALIGPLTLLQPVSLLATIAAQAIIMNAVFRATLEPENDRLFYLRIGGVELWQGLVQLCLQILLGFVFMIIFMVALFAGLIVGVAAMSSGVREFQPWMAVMAVLLLLAVVAFTVWLVLRLSMAGPMTFSDRTFQLFESWTLTRGRTGSLFLLALLIFLVVLLIEAVVISLLVTFVLLAAGGADAFADGEALEAFFLQSHSAWGPMLAGLVLFAVLAVSIAAGFVFAITLAPWADVYRQLGSGREGEAPAA